MCHRVPRSRLYELGKQKGGIREEFARENGKLDNELKAAEKAIARFNGDWRVSSQEPKRRTADKRSTSGSGRSPRTNESSEVSSSVHEREK